MAVRSEMSIFLEALERDGPAEREAYLAAACGGDERLRLRVEGLLKAHEKPGNVLDEIPAEVKAARTLLENGSGGNGHGNADDPTRVAEAVGSVIGPYRLMEQIGEGGVGLVFVAQQQRPLKRLVALKVIKPGMDTRQVVSRFNVERQALAVMDHPNIARVLDGGATETGRPYFVMELVRGVPVTEFCDQNKLDTKERLKLFVDICNAVQHAHQKGIIHRDLKPTNVLVTLHDGKPVVKVIDFGVAKAVGPGLTEHTVYSGFHQMIGTPLYMSPEQAEMSGLDVDTRSDIYSLGVLLYELLTGTTPYDRVRMRTVGFDEVRRIVREEDPPAPSTRLTSLGGELTTVSAKRRTEPSKLLSVMRGDLDWIVMKAMEKQRSRRYDTAAALAEDVRRFLHEEPLEARPPSAVYRFQKFARRNRLAITTASIVVVTMLLGTGISVWQAIQASEARAEADVLRKRAEDFADRLKQANVLLVSARDHMDQGRFAAADAEYCKAVDLQPEHYLVWSGRGYLYARLGLWRMAAEDYAQALELGEGIRGPGWAWVPQLFWYAGDEKSYRKSRILLMQQLERGGESGIETLHYIRAASFGPMAAVDMGDLPERIERMLTSGETWGGPGRGRGAPAFAYYIAGMVHYRAGNDQEAIARLTRALADEAWASRDIVYPLLAMAQHRSGKTQEAKASLAAAQKAIDQWMTQGLAAPPGTPPISTWVDWVEILVFHREAKALIDGEEPADDPRLKMIEAKAMTLLVPR